jgi:hypothetical protein
MASPDEHGFTPRVQRAILMLAEGDLDRLRHYVQAATGDWRDVLWWAEYPEPHRAGMGLT